MKRKIALIACFAAGLTVVKAQEIYNIEGTVKSVPGYKVTANLYYSAPGGGFVNDTCSIVNGHFSFKGNVSRPSTAFLALTDGEETLSGALSRGFGPGETNKLIQIGMFLENGTISVSLDYDKQQLAIISGTKNNDAYQEYRPVVEKYKKMEADLMDRNQLAADDTEKSQAVMNDYKTMQKERALEIGNLIKKYPQSLASLDLLRRWIDPVENLSGARTYYAYLSPELQNSRNGLAYLSRIKEAGSVDMGTLAPDFSLPDATGKIKKLSDYKGKYVLIDFWASWCVPCRKETPNLVKAYQQYKNKNFEILGVSLDGGKEHSKEDWLAAIKQDKMSWPQLSDLMAYTSAVVKSYSVSAIPMNFLIDPKGQIVGKNLRGQELNDVLSKLL